MRDTHDQQEIALFGCERIAPSYRGRRSSPQKISYRIGLAFAVALIGLTTAASAIAVRHASDTERSISAGANPGVVPGAVGFEAALY